MLGRGGVSLLLEKEGLAMAPRKKKQPEEMPVEPVASPSPEDFSDGAVQRAVMKKVLTSGWTLYPLTLGALGIAGLALIGSPILLAVGLGGLVVGGGYAVGNLCFRDETLADGIRADFQKKQKEAAEQARRQVRRDLKNCDVPGFDDESDQGVAQFDHVERTMNDLFAVLNEKLSRGELSYRAFESEATIVAESIYENLSSVVLLLKDIRSVDVGHIEKRQALLRRVDERSFTDSQREEWTALQERLDLLKARRDDVSRRLAANETAITVLETATSEVAKMQSGGTEAEDKFRSALEQLRFSREISKKFNG